MINLILNNIKTAITKKIESFEIASADVPQIFFEIPKEESHGDYSINVAMRLAKPLRKSPIMIAKDLVEGLDLESLHLEKVEIAGAGFINFYLDRNYLANVVFKILEEKENFAQQEPVNKKVLLEFVSANPTGYLHIGHGRGAAYGDSLAKIMRKAGYQVATEHYVNDGGNQIHNLTLSIYERYKELFGLQAVLGDDSYHGKEIITIAEEIKEKYGDYYLKNDYYQTFRQIGLEYLLNGLKKDLADFNVVFDNWFSEKSLYDSGAVESTLKQLTNDGHTYESENAIWLKTTEYNDEKDRVLVKSDGSYTYLMPDIAYHANKLSRGFDHLIDVLGADHHGYINRLKAAIAFVGGNPDLIDVDILQMVRVIQDGVEVKMSKRSGKAITLRDLIDEVGSDALRYMYISKALSTHMDLDLDLAIKNSNDNPVYYVQYAYARIASLFGKVADRGLEFKPVDKFEKISGESIGKIITTLIQYPNYIKEAAEKRLPHKMCQYAYMLATFLHSYYNDEKIISDDIQEMNEKLTLLKAVQIVLKDALSLIGVNVKERM